jgi:hypothetical protein
MADERERIRERLLRLNKEAHDGRFGGRDLSAVLGLWDRAKACLEKSDYTGADVFIDEAYRTLYLPQMQRTATVQAPMPQNAAKAPDDGGETVPVYALYEEPGFSDKLAAQAMSLALTSLRTIAKPRTVFRNLPAGGHGSEVISFYIGFSIILTITLAGFAAAKTGLALSHLSSYISALAGFIIAFIVASSAAHMAVKSAGGKGGYKATNAVCAFSLSPAILAAVAVLYVQAAEGPFAADGSVIPGGIPAAAAIAVLMACGIAWTLALQAIGFTVTHGLPFSKAATAAAANAATAAFLVFAVAAAVLAGGSLP